MESALAFLNGDTKLVTQNLYGAVIGHLEVVDAGHDGRQVVVRCVWRLARLADDSKHGREILKA
jgi:hypothetical protein